MTASEEPWALKLFRRSALKQAKWRALERQIGDTAGKECLDLGSDNGVLSWLCRQRGGRWKSADLAPEAVRSIRDLVGSDVYQIDGRLEPFPDRSFDLVLVIDMLEHVVDDGALVSEFARVLKPGGELVVNVPHLKPRAWTRPIRDAVGLDDEWHGHLRPGYDVPALARLFAGKFDILDHQTYSKSFSELLDIAQNAAIQRKKGTSDEGTPKGLIVTGKDVARFEREFRLLSFVYPAIRLFAALDRLCVFETGYFLVVRARRIRSPSE